MSHYAGVEVVDDVTALQAVIFEYFGPTTKINAYKTPEEQDRGLAEAIIAAGYRKPVDSGDNHEDDE